MIGKFPKVGPRIYGGGGLDPDASAFITAAGITDATQQSAINTLVVGMKNQGLWNKMKAVYPFVGGTATSHKFNLKDPRDLDAAFRLVFNGGLTHSATGVLPNGSNSWADTFVIPNSHLSLNSSCIGYYSRTSNFSNSTDIGVSDSGYNNGLYLLTNSADTNDYSRNNSNASLTVTSNGSLGLILNYRNSSTQIRIRVGTIENAYNNTSNGLSTSKISLFALNQGGVKELYSNRECAFALIADGLSTTDASNLYTLVQAFQTTLGRQV